ncbi:SprT-like domain-containing protein [Candidatus Leptofilum sp.]|uniref:SprT-like domain-containing protein n=1 Tax=Candidatus Leptofilum sp. TaxID=3241576 RepID=UPI003B5A8AD7
MSEEEAWPVKIVRSKKRKKTVSAELKNGELVVRAPARMSQKELNGIIEKLQKRLRNKMARTPKTDEELERIAQSLNDTYFNGRLQWQSIRYVTNQNKRFGSCTPSLGTIRISHRLAKMPDWVLKYVVVHELAHLEESNHGPNFWALVNQYPLTERARGYLMAIGLEEDTPSE